MSNETDPDYPQKIHNDLLFFASKDRSTSMGAANYHNLSKKHFGSDAFGEHFSKVAEPFEHAGYPDKGTTKWNEAIENVRKNWRSETSIHPLLKEDFAITDAGIAGTGDSRLPADQREPARANKYFKKKLRQVFKRNSIEDVRRG